MEKVKAKAVDILRFYNDDEHNKELAGNNYPVCFLCCLDLYKSGYRFEILVRSSSENELNCDCAFC